MSMAWREIKCRNNDGLLITNKCQSSGNKASSNAQFFLIENQYEGVQYISIV